MIEATRGRAKFSGHGGLGAAGERESSTTAESCEFLRDPGQSIAVSPGAGGFESVTIGVEWDNTKKKSGFFGKLLDGLKKRGVDLDLGCLYELQDGTRGALQAFGGKHGSLDQPPYIHLSVDQRTGDGEGYDEYIKVKGEHWSKIKRILVYIYIYKGASNWKQVNPCLHIDVPGKDDLIVQLGSHSDTLDLCAVGGIEQIRGGMKLTNYTEYFPGHMEMDRAFGFGLDWDDGQKD